MAAITAKLRKLTMDEAIAQPIDAPLRFKRGDRCECRCGECWYAATVVQTWWQPTGERTKMPYQCELDAGGLVWAPLDFDMCIREAPPPPPPRAHIVRAKPGVSKEVYGKFFGPGRACSGCDAEVGPMAVSRELDGRSAFTGIVRYGKLDLLPDESSVAGTSAGRNHAELKVFVFAFLDYIRLQRDYTFCARPSIDSEFELTILVSRKPCSKGNHFAGMYGCWEFFRSLGASIAKVTCAADIPECVRPDALPDHLDAWIIKLRI